MTQPTRYDRGYSFTDFSGTNPLLQQPGPRIDAELDAIELTTDQICDNLALIQRDDGKLRNGIVTRDALAVDTDFKGDPGGNVMAVGAAAALSSLTIPVGTDLVRTSEYRAGSKLGGAFYIADSAVNAAFVTAHPGWAFVSGNGRGFRLDPAQTIWFEMFGAYGDANASGVGTDDYPAWLIAKDFIHFHRGTPVATYYKPSVALHLRQVRYYSSLAWDLTDACYQIYGSGSNLQGYSGSAIFFASGQCGIICQSWDTAGVTSTKTNDGIVTGANGTNIKDISVISKGGTLEAQQHGILAKCAVILERVHAFDFGGDGIRIIASTPSTGNANGAILYNCGGTRNGMCGLYIAGADVNSIKNYGFQAYSNRMFGLNDSSFLGNTHLGYEPGGNGLQGQGPAWGTGYAGASVHYAGNLYMVRPGAHVAARTTTPGTNGAVWSFRGVGVDSILYPTWVSGSSYSSGGALYCGGAGYVQNNNNMSTFQGYFEQDQMPPWADSNEAASLLGLLQVGPGFYCANGTLYSGNIGSRTTGSDGRVIQYVFGGNPDNDGQYAVLGRATDSSTPWTFHVASDNTLTLKMFGSDAWHPYYILPFGSTHGMAFPLGISIGSVRHYSASAVPSSGTYIKNTYLSNDFTVSSKERGWRCTADGTPGTWDTEYRELYGSTTTDLASIGIGSNSTAITITVTGAAVGDIVSGISTTDGSIPLGAFIVGQVTAANTVTAFVKNNSAGAYDPPSATYRAKVTKQ